MLVYCAPEPVLPACNLDRMADRFRRKMVAGRGWRVFFIPPYPLSGHPPANLTVPPLTSGSSYLLLAHASPDQNQKNEDKRNHDHDDRDS